MEITFDKLISLHIVLPILGALLSVVFRKNIRVTQSIALGSLLLLFASSLLTLLLALKANEYRYSFGGWSAPLGIEFTINFYNATFLLLISGAALCSFLFGQGLLKHEMERTRVPIFNALFLICIFGMYGLVMTNDFFNLYVFIEINSLATYALVSWNSSNKNALTAAFYYLVVGSVAAIFILIGIGYLYGSTGTLNMSDFINKFDSLKHLKTVQLGICLITLGLLIKSALFPLHSWVLKVYKTTNSFILPFLGATSNKIYLFVFAKLFFLGLFNFAIMKDFFLPAGVITVTIFSFCAIYSKNLRMILAFSGLVQVGYIFILLGLEYKLSFLLITIQLVSYSVTALALFMLTASFEEIRGSSILDHLGRLTKEAPLYVILFVINSLSLIGVPITIRFLPKFAMFLDLIHNKSWITFAVTVCASLFTFIYLFKAINVFIFGTKPTLYTYSPSRPASFIEPAVILTLTFANIILGFTSLSFLKIFTS
jgi:multicomponent Na+:H+ antiporter subunit D